MNPQQDTLRVRKVRHFLYVYNIRMGCGGRENTSRLCRGALPTRTKHFLHTPCAENSRLDQAQEHNPP